MNVCWTATFGLVPLIFINLIIYNNLILRRSNIRCPECSRSSDPFTAPSSKKRVFMFMIVRVYDVRQEIFILRHSAMIKASWLSGWYGLSCGDGGPHTDLVATYIAGNIYTTIVVSDHTVCAFFWSSGSHVFFLNDLGRSGGWHSLIHEQHRLNFSIFIWSSSLVSYESTC